MSDFDRIKRNNFSLRWKCWCYSIHKSAMGLREAPKASSRSCAPHVHSYQNTFRIPSDRAKVPSSSKFKWENGLLLLQRPNRSIFLTGNRFAFSSSILNRVHAFQPLTSVEHDASKRMAKKHAAATIKWREKKMERKQGKNNSRAIVKGFSSLGKMQVKMKKKSYGLCAYRKCSMVCAVSICHFILT